MAEINPDKLKDQLSKIVENVLNSQNKAVGLGMLNFQADIIERVFTSGLDNDGNKIGNYSTEPIYVSLRSQTSQVRKSSLRPSGKFSKDPKFANGKERKSAYFEDGYKGYRAAVGRQNSTVDLRLTGSLQGSIRLGESDQRITVGISNDESADKAAGNEKRFGKIIFSPSEEELQRIENTWSDEVTNAFFNSFE